MNKLMNKMLAVQSQCTQQDMALQMLLQEISTLRQMVPTTRHLMRSNNNTTTPMMMEDAVIDVMAAAVAIAIVLALPNATTHPMLSSTITTGFIAPPEALIFPVRATHAVAKTLVLMFPSLLRT